MSHFQTRCILIQSMRIESGLFYFIYIIFLLLFNLCCSWFFPLTQNSPLCPPHPRAYITKTQRAPCEDPPAMATLCLARIWAKTTFLIIRWVRIRVAFPISPNSVFVFKALLFVLFLCLFTKRDARWSGYVIRLIFSGDDLLYTHLAPLTSCHVTWADQWAKATIMTSSSDMLPSFFPTSSKSSPVDFSTP